MSPAKTNNLKPITEIRNSLELSDQKINNNELQILHLQNTLKALTTKLKLSLAAEKDRENLEKKLNEERSRADDLSQKVSLLIEK